MPRKGPPAGKAMTGEELRRIREWLGLTQVQLAAQLHVTANTLRRWELGEVGTDSEPVARLLQLVAAAAGEGGRR
jgi:DNA-binding transcriptional regulator YiaG